MFTCKIKQYLFNDVLHNFICFVWPKYSMEINLEKFKQTRHDIKKQIICINKSLDIYMIDSEIDQIINNVIGGFEMGELNELFDEL